jgi:hypothetical protein
MTAGETTMGKSITLAKKLRAGKENRESAYPAGIPIINESDDEVADVQTVSQKRCHILGCEKKYTVSFHPR